MQWLHRSKSDPAWFSQHVLQRTPWSEQARIMASVRDNQETSVRSCHGIGKTGGIAAPLALWFLLTHIHDCIVITTAPSDRQVRGQLWGEINALYNSSIVPLGGRCLTQDLRMAPEWPKWFAIGFTAPDYDPSKFHGWHADNVLVIVDEACGISKDIYDGVDAITSTGVKTRILSIGNPTDPTSEFAGSFKRRDVSTFAISAFDTPNFTAFNITKDDITTGAWEEKLGNSSLPCPYLINPAWVAKMYHKHGGWESPYLQGRILAEFPSNNAGGFISLSDIEAAFNRDLDAAIPRQFGIDLGAGGDKSVIVERNGAKARVLDTKVDKNTMATVGWIRKHVEDRGPECVKVDATGLGKGVADRLEEVLPSSIPVHHAIAAAKSSDPDTYRNARAEWFDTLRKRFADGWIDLNDKDSEFLEQGSKLVTVPNSKGTIQIADKKLLKKLIGHSPDELDALAIAFADIEHSGIVIL